MGIIAYIKLAMENAQFKHLGENIHYGSIPGFKGVWACTKNLKACRNQLQEVLEDWVVLKIRSGDNLPAINGRKLKIPSNSIS